MLRAIQRLIGSFKNGSLVLRCRRIKYGDSNAHRDPSVPGVELMRKIESGDAPTQSVGHRQGVFLVDVGQK